MRFDIIFKILGSDYLNMGEQVLAGFPTTAKENMLQKDERLLEK
jgi:hypothetical protein